MNLELLIVALIIGKAVDWIFQNKWQAENKTKNFNALIEHSFWYAVLTSFFVILIIGTNYHFITFMFGLFLSHILIDNRWIVKMIMIHIKGLSKEQVYEKEYWWLEIGIDQKLHDLVILILVTVV